MMLNLALPTLTHKCMRTDGCLGCVYMYTVYTGEKLDPHTRDRPLRGPRLCISILDFRLTYAKCIILSDIRNQLYAAIVAVAVTRFFFVLCSFDSNSDVTIYECTLLLCHSQSRLSVDCEHETRN